MSCACQRGRAATGFAKMARGMAVIDHDDGAVFLGQVANRGKPGHVSVHREHAVRGDQFEASPVPVRFLQPILELVHVSVGEPVALRLAKTHAVDDGSVIERIRNDGVIGLQERLEDAAIGVEAGREQNCVILT